MQYAKLVSDTEVLFPSQDDLNPDGSLKDPKSWSQLVTSSKPGDVTVFKDYTHHFIQMDAYGESTIYQTWTAVLKEPQGRVAKLLNGNLVFPGSTEIINGKTCFGYDKQPNSRKMTDGWLLVEETEKPSDGIYTESGEIIPDSVYGQKIKIVWKLAPVIPEVPYDISKKKLLDILIELGKFDIFQSILDSDKILHEYWLVSLTLNSNDSIVKKMIHTFATMLNMTEDEIIDILKKCRA